MEQLLSRHLGALALGIAGALSGLPAAAQTPPCGTVVTQSIQLNADMHCTGNQPALIVGADNVRVDLNGYGIYGQLNWVFIQLNPPGIVAYGRQNVGTSPAPSARWAPAISDPRVCCGLNHEDQRLTCSYTSVRSSRSRWPVP
jgi:hypothetical protein